MVTLKELSDFCDFSNRTNPNNQNAPVIVTLANKSMGARAGCEISYISFGFDWESGQIRLEPAIPLVRETLTRDNVLPPKEWGMGDDKKRLYCLTCECVVNKKDKYCSHCGQRLN